MPSPTTYFEWAHLLDRYAQGDDTVLVDLEQGSFALDAGTVYRFHTKVQEAYVERKKQWADKFNRSFQLQKIRSESEMGIVLRNAKAQLQPVWRLVKLPGFPSDLHETLKRDFDAFVSDVRKNFKESALKNQPGNQKLLFVINTFDFYEAPRPTASSDESNETHSSKRRILF